MVCLDLLSRNALLSKQREWENSRNKQNQANSAPVLKIHGNFEETTHFVS